MPSWDYTTSMSCSVLCFFVWHSSRAGGLQDECHCLLRRMPVGTKTLMKKQGSTYWGCLCPSNHEKHTHIERIMKSKHSHGLHREYVDRQFQHRHEALVGIYLVHQCIFRLFQSIALLSTETSRSLIVRVSYTGAMQYSRMMEMIFRLY